MRNDVGVNGGIVQIIPELSYIIQISFLYSPSSFICYHCLVLWHTLLRLLSVQTDLISIPLCSSDIASPPRGVCSDWNKDQVSHHSEACRERPRGRKSVCLYLWVRVYLLSFFNIFFLWHAWCLCLLCAVVFLSVAVCLCVSVLMFLSLFPRHFFLTLTLKGLPSEINNSAFGEISLLGFCFQHLQEKI